MWLKFLYLALGYELISETKEYYMFQKKLKNGKIYTAYVWKRCF